MEKRLNLRFNLDREADRRAWEYLQSVGNRNKRIRQAVNFYSERLKEESKENAFLERIVDAVRNELRAAPTLALAQLLHAQERAVPEKSEETILDFLDGF